MEIREATEQDFDEVWPIFESIVSAGDTYAYRPDTSRDEARALWMEAPRKTFVAVDAGRIVGTYYIKTNQQGPGSHVCNCGYMVAASGRGRGVANSMCEHSQRVAVDLGYLAMQFNLVLVSNTGAVRLWERLGFETVGRVPMAYRHPTQGLVDALVMYKWLGE